MVDSPRQGARSRGIPEVARPFFYPFGRILREVVGPHLSADLVAPDRLARIIGLADGFEERVSSLYGLECPLSRADPVADFLFCSAQENGGDEVLAEAARARASDHPAWARVRDLAAPWDDLLENVWLEFDMEPLASSARAVPSVFLGPSSSIEPAARADHLTAALARLAPPGVDLSFVKNLAAAIPAPGRVFQAGAMLSRPQAPIRLCIRGLGAAAIGPFLDAHGWRGDRAARDRTLETFAPFVSHVDLAIDVQESIRPRIGLELRLASRVGGGPSPWTSVLDAAARDGIVHPLKRAALLASEGVATEFSHRQAWPRHLLAGSLFAQSAGYYSLVVWGIHHIKIAIEADGARMAKGYLAVDFQWAVRSR